MASKRSSYEAGLASLGMLFRLLSDPTRLRIVLLLKDGERTVTEICNQIKLPQPTISHHLSLLRMNRVIAHQRQGKQVIYSLDDSVKLVRKTLQLSVPPFTVTLT